MLILRLSIDNHMLSSLNRTYIHLALPRNTEIKLMVTHLLILTDKHPYSWLISLTLMSYLRRSFFDSVKCMSYSGHSLALPGLCPSFARVTGYGLVLSSCWLLCLGFAWALPGLRVSAILVRTGAKSAS